MWLRTLRADGCLTVWRFKPGAIGLLIGLWQWGTLTRRRREGDVVVDDRREVREPPAY